MEKEVSKLKFPADQRLAKIKSLIESDKLKSAEKEIKELKTCFPESEEAKEAENLNSVISEKREAIKAEKERLRALGFKALKTESTIQIDENKVVISNCQIGSKYTHDVYPTYSGSEWREHTADKGNKFISFNMNITSESKDPNIPTLAFYSVEGDKLYHRKDFWVNFARWSDYGCYLGNETDLINDFRKASTVQFRLGAQLENEYFEKPYIVVLKKNNALVRTYDRFENPPVSYEGDANYPYSLSLEDFNEDKFVAIKINIK